MYHYDKCSYLKCSAGCTTMTNVAISNVAILIDHGLISDTK